MTRVLVVAAIVLILLCGTCQSCISKVVAVASELPDLAVVEIFPSFGPKWLPMVPILPRVGEPFYLYFAVTNSADKEATNFAIDLRTSLQGEANRQQTSRNTLDRLDRGYKYINWGPFVVDRPSNLTVFAEVNADRTIAESDYSDNTMTTTFPVGELFPRATLISGNFVWKQPENKSFSAFSYTFDNGLHVATSSTGEVIATRSDAKHVVLWKNGASIYEVQFSPEDSVVGAILSPSGRYFATATFDALSVFDVEKLGSGNKTPLLSIGSKELGLVGLVGLAISDVGTIAVAGSGTVGKEKWRPSDFSVLVTVDSQGKKLWSRNFDEDLQALGPNFGSWIHSISFDSAGQLLVGVGTAYTDVPLLHELNPWLYLFDSSGNVLWRRYLNSPVSQEGAFVSSDGASVVAATEAGRVYYFNRVANVSYDIFVGYNIELKRSRYSLTFTPAVSPEGDCVAVADPANIYVLGPNLAPLFRIAVSNVTSLALGGGYVVAGRIGEAAAISLWDLVDKTIAQARGAIDAARGRSANVTEAQALYDLALSYRTTGHWYQAYSGALKSLTSAEEAPTLRQLISTTSALSTISSLHLETPPVGIILPATLLVIALAAIALVFFIRKKRPVAPGKSP
jgi:hypothetical protein